MIKRTMIILGLAAALAVGIAACGSSSDTSTTAADTSASTAATDDGDGDVDAVGNSDTSSGGGEAVKVTAAADGSLAYDESTLNANAGAVDLQLDNPSSTQHDVCVRSDSGDELGCSDSTSQGTADLSVDLPAGNYEFYCSEPGHEEAGMKGTLSVK
jgi:uncharacterized cupredoxin-like copper-binding protein